MDSKILTSAINYHGQELMRILQLEQSAENLNVVDLRNVNYLEYRQRASELGFHFRIRRQKLYHFIAKKANMLFKTLEDPVPYFTDKEGEELYGIVPPLEYYMAVPAQERRKRFFQTLKKGDLVIGKIFLKTSTAYHVHLICFDGGKRRLIEDLAVKCALPVSCIPKTAHPDNDGFQLGDLVRVAVYGYSPCSQKIILTAGCKMVPLTMLQKLKLGLITEEELPLHYRRAKKYGREKYAEVLEKTLSFNNPTSVQNLCNCLNLSSSSVPSLIKVLYDAQYPIEEFATALRKMQSSKWALKSVREGVAYFKSGNVTEAFQCLNKALQIDNENVDALVARGALFANNNNLRRAVEDFEKALEVNSTHANARKYLSETLVAVGKMNEEKKDAEAASKAYLKAIELNSNNTEAKDALTVLKGKQAKIEANVEAVAPVREGLKVDQASQQIPVKHFVDVSRIKLKQLLKEEKKEKKKKKYSSSSSTTSSSSSSSSSSSYSKSRSYSRSPKNKKGTSSQTTKDIVSRGRSYNETKFQEQSSHKNDVDEHKEKCERFLMSNLKKLAKTQGLLEDYKSCRLLSPSRSPGHTDISLEERLKTFYKRVKLEKDGASQSLKYEQSHRAWSPSNRKQSRSPKNYNEDRSRRRHRDHSPTSRHYDQSPRNREDRSPRRREDRSPRRREDRSPRRREDRSPRRREDRSPRRHEDRSPRQHEDRSSRQREDRSPRRREDRSPRRHEDRSPRRHEDKSPRRREDRSPRRREDRSPRLREDRSPRRREDRSPRHDRSPKSRENYSPKYSRGSKSPRYEDHSHSPKHLQQERHSRQKEDTSSSKHHLDNHDNLRKSPHKLIPSEKIHSFKTEHISKTGSLYVNMKGKGDDFAPSGISYLSQDKNLQNKTLGYSKLDIHEIENIELPKEASSTSKQKAPKVFFVLKKEQDSKFAKMFGHGSEKTCQSFQKKLAEDKALARYFPADSEDEELPNNPDNQDSSKSSASVMVCKKPCTKQFRKRQSQSSSSSPGRQKPKDYHQNEAAASLCTNEETSYYKASRAAKRNYDITETLGMSESKRKCSEAMWEKKKHDQHQEQSHYSDDSIYKSCGEKSCIDKESHGWHKRSRCPHKKHSFSEYEREYSTYLRKLCSSINPELMETLQANKRAEKADLFDSQLVEDYFATYVAKAASGNLSNSELTQSVEMAMAAANKINERLSIAPYAMHQEFSQIGDTTSVAKNLPSVGKITAGKSSESARRIYISDKTSPLNRTSAAEIFKSDLRNIKQSEMPCASATPATKSNISLQQLESFLEKLKAKKRAESLAFNVNIKKKL